MVSGEQEPSTTSTVAQPPVNTRRNECSLSQGEKDGRVFIVSGGYPDVRRALLARGWVENPDAGSRHFDLKWVLKCSEIDFAAVAPGQLCNHFQNISQLATKVGLNSHLSEARGILDCYVESFYARSFHLSCPSECEAFATQYKLQKAEGILKEWSQHVEASFASSATFPDDVVEVALSVVKRHIEDIDSLLDEDDNEAEVNGFSISEDEWAVLEEVDMACPSKENRAVQSQKQAACDSERVQDQTQQALRRQKELLQTLARQHQEKEIVKQQALVRKVALRRKISMKVLGDKALKLLPPTSTKLDGLPLAPIRSPWASNQADIFSECGNFVQNDQPAIRLRHTRKGEDVQNAVAAGQHPFNFKDRCMSRAELVAEVSAALEALKASPHFAMSGSRNKWIMKPAGRSRGRGIFVSSNLKHILHVARQERETTTWICQKYIENPLLLNGRKNDLRQWVLVTSWNPLTIWYYGECYVRLAANQYGDGDGEDNMSCLTNNAIACHHPKFDKNDEYWRCMWDQATYQEFLHKANGADVWSNKLAPAMRKIVVRTLTAVQDALASSCAASSCFEFLGFDFLVDEELRVWLLEVNTSPCMEYSTSILQRLVPEALDDAVRVILDGEAVKECAPARSPCGGFELLHVGPNVAHDRPTQMEAMGLALNGRQMAGRPTLVDVTPVLPPAKLLQEAQRRAEQELVALAEKRQLRLDQEQQRKERKLRIQKVLRTKVLRNRASLPVDATDANDHVDTDPSHLGEPAGQVVDQLDALSTLSTE